MSKITDIERGLPDDQEWVDNSVRRNLKLTSDRLSAPVLEARGLSSGAPGLVPVPLGTSLNAPPRPKLDTFAPPRTVYEKNLVIFHPPRVDEFGNTYEAVSRPTIPPEVQESWLRLKDKAIFDYEPTKYRDIFSSLKDAVGQDPADYYNDPRNAIGNIKFLGKNDQASPLMSEILRRVERGLSQSPIERGFAALQVRPIAGSKKISLHATGNAVDIDAGRNPHIKSKTQIAVVKAVTGIDLGEPQSRDELRRASDTFQRDFDRRVQQLRADDRELKARIDGGDTAANSLRQRQSEIRTVLQAIDADGQHNRRGDFAKWRDEGFFNLPSELIDAFFMADPSVVWGGEYAGSKDFMHFEYNPRRRAVIDKRAKRTTPE